MGGLLLGIDVGTSGVKAGLFDAEGRLRGLGRSPYRVDVPHPGWAEVYPELWWTCFLSSLAEACDAAGVTPDAIGAVGLSVLYPAVTALDSHGTALHPAILYCDQRSRRQVSAIERRFPRKDYEGRTGNALVPGTCAATSMLWLRDEAAHAYEAARVVAFANTFVSFRLVGDFFADPSMVSLSGLARIDDPWQWSDDLCDKLAIPRHRLPNISGSADVIGNVTPEAARTTGLKAGTPVVCGAGDTVCCALGAGVVQEGSAVYIAGSTDGVAVPLDRPKPDARWVSCANVPRDAWLGIATTSSSGVSIEWFMREFLNQDGVEGIRHMTDLASTSPPGSRGLIYLPYLQGERTPIWDPLARGAFVGLSAGTRRADLARAVFEGTAFSVRHLFESVEDIISGKVTEIRAVGGGTRNALWNQIKADVLQRPFDVLEFQEIASLGAALLGGIGSGMVGSFGDAADIARAAVPVRTVEPDAANADLCERLYDLYAEVYPGIKHVSHALAEWRIDQE